MARMRWGSTRPTNVDAARERLVDAATMCFDQFGESKTTVDDVATQAQVSRATAYRYFRGRDDMLAAVAVREALALADEIGDVVDGEQVDGAALQAGLVGVLVAVGKNERLRRLVATPRDAEPYVEARLALFEPLVGRAATRSATDERALVDWLASVVVGLLGTGDGAIDDAARLIEMFVVPTLLRTS